IEVDLELHGEKLGYYKLEKRGFVVNDVVIFSNGDNNLGFKNGMRGKVIAVNDRELTVDIDGVIYTIDPEKFPYLDHGYSVTDYKSQGSTTGHLIAIAHPRMASQNSFYTQITRCKHEATIITSSIEKFTQNAHKLGVAQSTVGMKRLPNDVALESLWGRKIPLEEKPVVAPKPENPIIKEILIASANEAITIPDFIKKCKEKGVYVNLRNGVAVYDGERVKLNEKEIKTWKKQFRKNHAIALKNGEIKK
ncbi:hypothetical protein C9925_01125, partial [cyanobacterium G8-9]